MRAVFPLHGLHLLTPPVHRSHAGCVFRRTECVCVCVCVCVLHHNLYNPAERENARQKLPASLTSGLTPQREHMKTCHVLTSAGFTWHCRTNLTWTAVKEIHHEVEGGDRNKLYYFPWSCQDLCCHLGKDESPNSHSVLFFVHEKNNHQSDTCPIKNNANVWSESIQFNTDLTVYIKDKAERRFSEKSGV